MNSCVLIPIYNHPDTIAQVLAQIDSLSLPCIVVDDGSDLETQRILSNAASQYQWLEIIRQAQNAGKGTAVQRGLRYADQLGYSHAVQIDADGQHSIRDVERLLAQAALDQSALILGKPVFGSNVPWTRYIGRQFSRWCVWVETLSFAIGDPLFGFRVYPLARTLAVMEKKRLGCGMDFDLEIAVRFYLDGGSVKSVDTPVLYPEGGVSHFRMLYDNMRISWLHTRLLLGTIGRLPSLLRRRDEMTAGRRTDVAT